MAKKSKEEKELIASNEPETYQRYLAKKGENAETVLADAEAKIRTDASFGSADYGAKKEELSEKGLLGSGFADYLKGALRKEQNIEYAKALNSAARAEYKNLSGYAAYMKNYSAAQDKIRDSLFKKVADEKIYDSESAYRLGLEMGLSEQNALFTAASAVSNAKKQAIIEAVEYSKKHGLYPYNAKQYALNSGLDEKSAELVYQAIKKQNASDGIDYENMTPDEYTDILNERLENNE